MCVLHKLSKIIPAIAAGLKDSTHLVTGYTASHVPARA
uniref:Uncharacterized protein n=1 Tax=Curvibacter symbiont subsp. Hydra magnipapillata TaxID=667019 RepID=C9YG22_CURXX|nr:hypothetical protein Csp_B17220 [Curvibacter putative symbiont of Hydra magnipapillata]